MIDRDNRFATVIVNRYIKFGLLLIANLDVDMDYLWGYFRQSNLIAVCKYSLVVKSEQLQVFSLEPCNLVHYLALFICALYIQKQNLP